MKKLVSVTEVAGEGLPKLLGERVTLFCKDYVLIGLLTSVDDDCILLLKPSIVYETCVLHTKDWMGAERLPIDELGVMKTDIKAVAVIR